MYFFKRDKAPRPLLFFFIFFLAVLQIKFPDIEHPRKLRRFLPVTHSEMKLDVRLVRAEDDGVEPPANEVLRFFVVGDFVDAAHSSTMLTQMEKYAKTYPVDFIVATGNSAPVDEHSHFTAASNYSSLDLPWHSVLGSKECTKDRLNDVLELSKSKAKWQAKQPHYARNMRVSVDGKAETTETALIKLVFANTCSLACADLTAPRPQDLQQECSQMQGVLSTRQRKEQLTWLASQLEYSLRSKNSRKNRGWAFVFGHHPVHTLQTGADGDMAFSNLLTKTNTDAYFYGQDQNLHHILPAEARETSSPSAVSSSSSHVEYFLNGGNGYSLHWAQKDKSESAVKYSAVADSFLVVSASAEFFQVEYIGLDGTLLYTFSKTRSEPVEPSSSWFSATL